MLYRRESPSRKAVHGFCPWSNLKFFIIHIGNNQIANYYLYVAEFVEFWAFSSIMSLILLGNVVVYMIIRFLRNFSLLHWYTYNIIMPGERKTTLYLIKRKWYMMQQIQKIWDHWRIMANYNEEKSLQWSAENGVATYRTLFRFEFKDVRNYYSEAGREKSYRLRYSWWRW